MHMEYFVRMRLSVSQIGNNNCEQQQCYETIPVSGCYCHLERHTFGVMGNTFKSQKEW